MGKFIFYEHLSKWGYTMSDRLEASAETKLEPMRNY
ncbi:hypothetical protein NRS6167_02785 [Bacillus subtilis]|nr:hypothetical protein NRS6167_02923 [Bacillus subtilis]CAI6229177.1 hypothetical protein NRS6167_02785 [Bacillus subtilis]